MPQRISKEIPGDPLTGSLPRTQLVVPQDVLGPVRTRYTKITDSWPHVADPMGVTMKQLIPGRIARVRTRRGVRTWQVRTVNVSTAKPNRGRHYITAMDRNGYCHSVWVDQVISVETVQRALAAAKVLKAIGPGSSR